MTVKNLEGSLQNLANTSVDITEALEERGENITGLSQAGDAIRRLAAGQGDGITVESGNLQKAIAYDVAIDGDLDDLASARGQIGDLSTITDLTITKTGNYYVSNTSLSLSTDNTVTITKAILKVYNYGNETIQYLYPVENNDSNNICYCRIYNSTSWGNWFIKNPMLLEDSIPLPTAGYMTDDTPCITMHEGTRINFTYPFYVSLYLSEEYQVPLTIPVNDRAGKDVYIWALVNDNKELSFALSLSSTSPNTTGYTNSYVIGGFHCLCADVGVIEGHTLSEYTKGAIIPNSIWTEKHRPVSDPEGMVWVPEINKWVDIYLPSWNGSKLISKYRGVIADGASSPSFNGSKFAEYAALSKKELISYDEFTVVAKGSNEGTSIIGASDPNTAGGHFDTAGRRMISNYGLEDCCGVLWQWSRTLFEGGATSPKASSTWKNSAGQNVYTDGDMRYYLDNYAWYKESVYNPAFDSQQYGSCHGLLRRALLGGSWVGGSLCGSRAVACRDFSADGWSDDSARLVSSPRV